MTAYMVDLTNRTAPRRALVFPDGFPEKPKTIA
jgi:hypothetical protein